MISELWALFSSFFTIGLFTFGGGYAMLPLLTRELVDRRGWVTEQELADYFAIGQCTPGIIAVNTATFVGYKRKKYAGGIAATLGLIAPSCVIIAIIAAVLSEFMDAPAVASALAGVRAAVCGLIFASAVKMAKAALIDRFSVLLFAAGLLAALISSLPTAAIILCAGMVGAVRVAVAGGRAQP